MLRNIFKISFLILNYSLEISILSHIAKKGCLSIEKGKQYWKINSLIAIKLSKFFINPIPRWRGLKQSPPPAHFFKNFSRKNRIVLFLIYHSKYQISTAKRFSNRKLSQNFKYLSLKMTKLEGRRRGGGILTLLTQNKLAQLVTRNRVNSIFYRLYFLNIFYFRSYCRGSPALF